MKLSNKLLLPVLSLSLIASSAFAMHNLSKTELKHIQEQAIAKSEYDRQSKESETQWQEARKNDRIFDENVGLVFETALFAGCLKLSSVLANTFPHDATLGMLMKATQIATTCGYYSELDGYKHASQGVLFLCSGVLACTAYHAITQ